MAGYIVKVVIEDTHPPVWRRIILPEMITLADLHQVLQCAFQWDDYHLHRFEALKPKKFWLEDTEEDRISADLFLQTGKELRYVYDFGDDWKHRILFEKEEPEYDVRYATVIKYKGDSFKEDSGGAWLAQSVKGTRISFDMQEINQNLQKMHFLVHEDTEEDAQMLTELFAPRIEDELSRASQAKLQELQTKLQELEAKLRQIEDSYNKELAPSVLETRVTKWWNRPEKQIIAKGSTEKTSVQLLTDGNLRTICDYCKYIGIAELEDVRLGAQAVWAQLERHPEYLAIICVWEELQSLLEFFRLPNGVCSKKPDDHAIAIALSLGFMDMREERVDRRNYLMLCPTRDAQKILSGRTDAQWKQACESTQRTKMAVADLLYLYSLIEIPAFCDLYRHYYDVSAKDEDIQRIIYLGGTFRKEITTGVRKTNAVPFIAENYLDSEQVLQLLEKADASEMNYRIFSKEERKKAKEGFGSLYPAWQEYYQFIEARYELDEEELEDWMQADYQDVRNGCITQELWEDMLAGDEFEEVQDYAVLWKIYLEIYLSTGLPQYKGYSRREYAKNTGIPLSQICEEIASEENVSTVTREMHLYELPVALQLRVHDALKVKEPARQAKELERILKELQDGNCEIEFFYAVLLFNSDRLQEAKELFLKIRKDYPEDMIIRDLLHMTREGLQKKYNMQQLEKQNMQQLEVEAQVWKNANLVMPNAQDRSGTWTNSTTYRREQPKVGRNDPCPCGSGKKYKKCCGK